MSLPLLVLAGIMAGAAAGLALWRSPQLPRAWPLLAIALTPLMASILNLRVFGMFFVSMGAIALWCFWNRGIAGVPILAIGVGLNLLAMAAHGGSMPIYADLLAPFGEVVAPGTILRGSKDIAVVSSPLWMLSDWIVLPYGRYALIVSLGDLLVLIGIVWWLLYSHDSRKDKRYARHNYRAAGTITLRTE
jgi:Family of unknown function (DUF5317)